MTHPAWMNGGLLRRVDAITVRVPDLNAGVRFYVDVLGQELKWRNNATGQAGLRLPDGDSELVLTTELSYEPNWLVERVEDCVETFLAQGGELVVEPFDIPVGRVAVLRDPFGKASTPPTLKGTSPAFGQPPAERVAERQSINGQARLVSEIAALMQATIRAAVARVRASSPPIMTQAIERSGPLAA